LLEERLPSNPTANDDETIDKCIEELTSAIEEAIPVYAPKRRPGADTRFPLAAAIRDEIRSKNRLSGQ
jgi:hypothetical protein